MELFVYSRHAIEAARPHEVPHLIISITSGPEDVARLRTTGMCKGILRLVFLDAEEPTDPCPEDQLFSKEQARRLWAFVLEHRGQVERIVVHCDAGKSRSPAVAAALAHVFEGDRDEFMGGRYRPNMRVYRTLIDTYPEVPRPRSP